MLLNNFISSFTGTVASNPIEINLPEKGLSFTLKIERTSGYEDIVEVVTTDFSQKVQKGEYLRVVGFLYTYQNNLSEYPKLRVCIYSTAIVRISSLTNKNVVICQGVIVKHPKLRATPSGILICDVLLAVNNELSRVSASYVPCICWNGLANQMGSLSVGTPIYAIGRLQSREYEKQIGNITHKFLTREFSINTFKVLEDKYDEKRV